MLDKHCYDSVIKAHKHYSNQSHPTCWVGTIKYKFIAVNSQHTIVYTLCIIYWTTTLICCYRESRESLVRPRGQSRESLAKCCARKDNPTMPARKDDRTTQAGMPASCSLTNIHISWWVPTLVSQCVLAWYWHISTRIRHEIDTQTHNNGISGYIPVYTGNMSKWCRNGVETVSNEYNRNRHKVDHTSNTITCDARVCKVLCVFVIHTIHRDIRQCSFELQFLNNTYSKCSSGHMYRRAIPNATFRFAKGIYQPRWLSFHWPLPDQSDHSLSWLWCFSTVEHTVANLII